MAFRRNRGPLTNVEKYRLQVLLTLAFGAMFLAFLPELLQLFGFGSDWRRACAGIGIYSIAFVTWWIAASRAIVRVVPEIFDWMAFGRMAAGHVAVVALQACVVFGVIIDSSAGVYLLGLIWYLVHAAQQFARMLFVQPGPAQD
ncbi:MAG: hypothetical protein R3288_02035 [Woeseiaceae bacterium]|nr:hypothetical protein [Woeseiaceae bacterium]